LNPAALLCGKIGLYCTAAEKNAELAMASGGVQPPRRSLSVAACRQSGATSSYPHHKK
jgi:hypothetical protein